MNLSYKESKTRKYIFALLAMLIVCAIFLRSFYWAPMGGKRKIAIIVLAFFSVIFVPFLTIRIRMFNIFLEKILERFSGMFEKAKKCKSKIIRTFGIILVCVLFLCLISYLVSEFVLETLFNIKLFYTLLTLFFLALGVVVLWKNASKKPEKIFVVVALIMGLFCIGVTPDRSGVSWDDQIHYERTLEISNVFNGVMYEADMKNIANTPFYGGAGQEREVEQKYKGELEESYASKKCGPYEFGHHGVWSISYVPPAVGILLGRGLGLSYAGVYNMGRFFNLLTYTTLIYFAIKRIKYGKVLIAAIGLMPTSIFMASCYSYDPWVTGFTILGFSYFFAELQDEGLLENKNIVIMIGALVLGCLPKAIYFPMLFPLLFMPKKKFKDSKQRTKYLVSVVGAALLLLSTFLLPMLIRGAGTGDSRGGSDVNSSGQLAFILNNPIAYAGILIRYMARYITLQGTSEMFDSLGYAGMGYVFSVVSFVYVVVAFLDRGECEENHVAVKGATLLGNAAAIVLSITALYISFTAVASDTVAGMQGRYMIPTLFPALFSLGFGGTTHKLNKNAFACVPMLIIAITFICNMFALCVIKY